MPGSVGKSPPTSYITWQQEEIVTILEVKVKEVEYEVIETPYGHDGFLIEFEKMDDARVSCR